MKTTGNQKKERKPKYTMWQGLCFMVKTAWRVQKSVLATCLALAAANVALSLAQLYVAPEILGKVEQGASVGELLLTIGFFTAALFLLSGLQRYLEENRMSAQIEVRMSLVCDIVQKCCKTSYPNIRDSEVLKLRRQAEIATNGNDEATEAIWQTLTRLLSNVACFVIYLALISNLSPILAVVVIVTAVVGYYAIKYIGEWDNRNRKERSACDEQLRYLHRKSRSREFAKDIRIFGLVDWMHELRGKVMKTYTAYITRREKAYLIANIVDVVMTLLRNAVAYGYLLYITLTDRLSASQFLLYFAAATEFTTWVKGILSRIAELHSQSMDISYVQEFLNLPEQFKFEDGITPPAAERYELRLENVTFRYPGADKNTLEKINLTIRPGEKLAIVGLNGAGKTTLIKLLCGFYDPTAGRVLLNGQDIRDFNRREYYELFSAVFQDFSQLDCTVAETVAQSIWEIDREKVSDCIAKAGLAATIEKFPKGLDTHIGRDVYLDGVLLSGGQTQRLMLARALYKDGPILVLDEPTAALDPIAENDIYLKYHEMTAGKTSVYISHRLASTRFCDRILLIADGGIAEEGTHEELLHQGGKYAELFEIQSRYYREGGEDNEEEN